MRPRSSTRFAAILSMSILTLALALAAPPAQAQISSAEKVCRARLSKAMGKVAKAAHKSVARCHKLRDKGDLSAATDCNVVATADSETKGKLAKAVLKLDNAVSGSCASVPSVLALFPRCPAPNQTVDDGGATTGIDDYAELQACLVAHVESGLESTATEILGLPAGLDSDGIRCHGALAKSLGRVIDATVKRRSKCQTALDKAGGPLNFVCATFDDGRIAATITKASGKVASSCESSGTEVESCASDGTAIAGCAIEEAAPSLAGGMASMIWELAGVCPGQAFVHVETDLAATDEDRGTFGIAHDNQPVSDYDLAIFDLSCDADCANCTGADPFVPADHCRCEDDSSVACASNGDCAGLGDLCRCYVSPPIHESGGGLPVCRLPHLDGPLTGAADATSGEVTLTAKARERIHTGISLTRPCPTCEDGICDGGERDGLPCSADGIDETFGNTSLDCPPDSGANVTGEGLRVPLNLTTAAFSLPFAIPCDSPNGALLCACSTCSLDNTLACNSDAECIDAGAGTCRTDGGHGGNERRPNSCGDASCETAGSDEGVCSGELDRYCSGALTAAGRGIISCATNTDCDVYVSGSLDPDDWICPGDDCGSCSVDQERSCFLDPVAAQGTPGSLLVGGGCYPVAGGSFLSGLLGGLPGAFRTQKAFSLDSSRVCPDGVTPYEAPGGSNCP